ncbi:hypothetical protein HDU87_001267 [Geranomyces variabilis]|uniref:Uncharacterized protein n=1 Tax=Geranomyces variabilis TaxID=109894 RepID=A0AAD5TCF8_9FUNG|nr:hypothetical protein HDU87_001267 [Geranomyces variabilis]
MSQLSARKPVFAVIGTTGVGKSQLGVELAHTINGEVINADSMQVYKGLDIATNKAPMHERQGVPHHLLDFVHPSKEYSVADFERDALRTISEIHARGRIPILVGGTNYYVQAVLFENRIIATSSCSSSSDHDQDADDRNDDGDATAGADDARPDIPSPALASHPLAARIAEALRATDARTVPRDEIGKWSQSSDLLGLLAKVDPVMADRWHVKDVRKIRRSLQIFYTTGRRHSDIMAEQRQGAADPASGDDGRAGQLRFDTCVFWLYAEPTALYPRLDARVGDMINLGLFNELHAMRAIVRSGGVVGVRSAGSATADNDAAGAAPPSSSAVTPDYTRGILQAIGFKEFEAYLSAIEEGVAITDAKLESLKARGLEDMKRGTRQYARRQVAWIKNKLAVACLGKLDAAGHGTKKERMGFYLLDATSLDDWSTNIAERAVSLAKGNIHALCSYQPVPTLFPASASKL